MSPGPGRLTLSTSWVTIRTRRNIFELTGGRERDGSRAVRDHRIQIRTSIGSLNTEIGHWSAPRHDYLGLRRLRHVAKGASHCPAQPRRSGTGGPGGVGPGHRCRGDLTLLQLRCPRAIGHTRRSKPCAREVNSSRKLRFLRNPLLSYNKAWALVPDSKNEW